MSKSKAQKLFLTIVAIEAARAEAHRQVDMYLAQQRHEAFNQYDANMQYLDQTMHSGDFDAERSFDAPAHDPTSDKFRVRRW